MDRKEENMLTSSRDRLFMNMEMSNVQPQRQNIKRRTSYVCVAWRDISRLGQAFRSSERQAQAKICKRLFEIQDGKHEN